MGGKISVKQDFIETVGSNNKKRTGLNYYIKYIKRLLNL